MRKKKENGFTLVEILITIAIICVIGTIAGTTIFNTIKNSKEKSLEITRNNVLKSARTYVEEYHDRIAWVNKENISNENKPNTEEKEIYSCISINELINKNLIKKEKIKDDNLSQYAIIWKNKDNIITSEEFDENTNKICNNTIDIINPPTNEEYCIEQTYNGEKQTLVKQAPTSSFTFNSEEIEGINAGTYKITAKITPGNYWKDGTTNDKFIYCPINKAQPELRLTPSKIETEEVLTEITTTLTSNVNGTIVLKESNPDYYTAKISRETSKSSDGQYQTDISIKSLSTRNIEGTITITLIPEDTNNYYISTKTLTINKPTKNLISIEKPTCKNATYDGKSHTLIESHEGYSISPTPTYSTRGTHEITISLNYGYKWTDNTIDDYTLKCEITTPIFKVSYDKNHNEATGTMTDSIVTYGELFKPKENEFMLEGHKFSSWNDEQNRNGNKWDANTEKKYTKLEDTKLYAQWVPNTVNIVYSPNGGTVSTTTNAGTWTVKDDKIYLNEELHTTKINYGETLGVSGLTDYYSGTNLQITYPGHKVATNTIWKCLEGCTTEGKLFDQTTQYDHNDFCDASNEDCTVVLGVNWQPPTTVNITYSPNGGTVSTTTNAGTWTVKDNKIYLNGNLHTTKINYGETLGVSGLTDYYSGTNLQTTYLGYHVGTNTIWKCLEGCTTDGKIFDQTTQYNHNEFCDASKNDCEVTLGVNWQKNIYTIKYDGNDNTSGSTPSSTHEYDTTKSLNKNGYIKIGHTFNGWNTKRDGTGIKYTNEQSVKNLSSTDGTTIILYAQWIPNKINVKFHTNGGTIKGTNTSYKANSNGIVLVNENEIAQTYNYGAAIDLLNYNNSSYLYITKNNDNINYYVKTDEEWNTKADGSGTSFSQFGNKHNANELCNANQSDCTVTLYVNWKYSSTIVDGNRYYCTNTYDNTYRLSIFDNITCTGNNCNYTKINGLTSSNINTCNNTNLSTDDRGNCQMIFTPTWNIESSYLTPTISNNCITTKYVRTTSGNGLNCRSGASTKTDRITGVSDCAKITVSKTTTKFDSDNNWFYVSDAECYLSGKYLYSSQQCSSGSGGNTSDPPNPVMCGKCSSDSQCGSNMTCSGTCTGTNGSYSCCVVQRNQAAVSMCN